MSVSVFVHIPIRWKNWLYFTKSIRVRIRIKSFNGLLFLDYFTMSALLISNVDLRRSLQQGQWKKLFDFGPTIIIDTVYAGIPIEATLVDAYKEFISDKTMDTPKRGKLTTIAWESHALRLIFQANIDAFLAATQPWKLFQEIEIHTAKNNMYLLADQVQRENILKLMRQEFDPKGPPRSRIFRIDHSKLKLAMDVEFQVRDVGDGAIKYKIVHL